MEQQPEQFPARIVTPPAMHARCYHLAGALLLLANRVRYALLGYRRPRPFPVSDYERATRYDLDVVRGWQRALGAYTGRAPGVAGRSVLELGPGADLGIGLYLLALGATRYRAIDVSALAASAPDGFYEHFLGRLATLPEAGGAGLEQLRVDLEALRRGAPARLDYIVQPDFDLTVLGEQSVEIAFSQAAFEHFDDVAATIRRLARVMRPGGILVAEVDLQTHTRGIRERDPLNLYRHGDRFYRFCRFRGAPNRVRPPEYARHLEEHGWHDVRILPDVVLDPAYVARVTPSLAPRFRPAANRMELLSFYLCATRG